MSEKYKFYTEGLHFITMTIVGWIDLFTRKAYADLIVENLNHCIEHKGLQVYSYCIMPSHVHLIANCKKGNLSDIIRDFKAIPHVLFLKK